MALCAWCCWRACVRVLSQTPLTFSNPMLYPSTRASRPAAVQFCNACLGVRPVAESKDVNTSAEATNAGTETASTPMTRMLIFSHFRFSLPMARPETRVACVRRAQESRALASDQARKLAICLPVTKRIDRAIYRLHKARARLEKQVLAGKVQVDHCARFRCP